MLEAYKRLVKLYSLTTFVLSQLAELCSRHYIPIPDDIDENIKRIKKLQEEVAEDIKTHLPKAKEFDD